MGLGLGFVLGVRVGMVLEEGHLRGELVDDVADVPPLVKAHVARAEREAVHLVRVKVMVMVRVRFSVRVRVRVLGCWGVSASG